MKFSSRRKVLEKYLSWKHAEKFLQENKARGHSHETKKYLKNAESETAREGLV